MRKWFVNLFVVFSLSVGVGIHPVFGQIAVSGKAQRDSSKKAKSSQDAKGVEERIRRIENGLALPATIKGAPPVRLKLAERMHYYNAPGVSIAVINNGKIEWARGYGVKETGKSAPVTPDTLFAAGSVSKPVAAMGALNFVDKGKLDLDADVNNKLVSWKVPENEYTKQSKVTLRRLLNHTSGLPIAGGDGKPYRYGDPFPTIVQALNGYPAGNPPIQVEFTPNCKWSYSNAGYGVVQLLMMDVAGKPFPDVMQETVFSKLGMAHSTFENPLPPRLWNVAATGHRFADGQPNEGKYPATPAMAAGGLWTTPTDLARFIIELQKAKAGKSDAILSQKTASLMLTPLRAGWGLGLDIDVEGISPRFSHNGSVPGFTGYMVAYNWRGQGAVVMTNVDSYNGFQLATEIMLGIAREYGWEDFVPVEKTIARVNPQVYENYAGYYEIDNGFPVTVVARNNRLFLTWALGNTYEMYPESETKFFIARDGAPTYEFLKDENGNVTGIKRDWYGGTGTGKKAMISAPSIKGNTTFKLSGHNDALTVSLAGTFNGWNSRQTLCAKEDDGWACRIDLVPGKYSYKFAVDNKFMLDPLNPKTEGDGQGNINSVVIVTSK